MTYKVLFDGNDSGLINVVGVGLFMPLKAHQDAVNECELMSRQLTEMMAERDALAAQGEALRSNKISVVTECLSIVEKNKTTVGASQYWRGTDITASKFKENVIADLKRYAEQIRRGVE